MKKYLKIFSVLLTLVLVLSLSAVAYAYDDTNAYYYQDDGAAKYVHSDDITVYLTVESNRTSILGGSSVAYRDIPVTLDVAENTTDTFSVLDALLEVQNDPAYSSYGLTFEDAGGNKLEDGDTYFMYVEHNGIQYGPSGLLSFDGWMVRINDRFAIDSWDDSVGGLKGESINTMLLENRDHIHLYVDNTTSSSTCVPFTKLTSSYSNGTITTQVQESHNYFGSSSPYPWTITGYSNYGVSGMSFTVYNSSGQSVATGNGSSSTVTISAALPAGTYTVVLDRAFKSLSKSLKYTGASATFVVQ